MINQVLERFSPNKFLTRTPGALTKSIGAVTLASPASGRNMPPDLMPLYIATVQAEAEPEYDIYLEDGLYRASNTAHQLRVTFMPTGPLLQMDGPAEVVYGMTLTAVGYGTDLHPVDSATLSVCRNRLEYCRGALTEWYVNGSLGLEQGFTLEIPPAGRREGEPLVVELAVSKGLIPALSENSQTLTLDFAGETSLRLDHLYVTDAEGRSLQAHLDSTANRVRLVVDDTGAIYPLTIDPLIQQRWLTADDGAGGSNFSCSVDLSNDGNTALIGAYGQNYDTGAAYVFVRSGITWTQQQKLTASDGASNDWFGASVSLSGDGNTALVGAESFRIGGAGAAYVYVRSGTTWTQQQKLTDGVEIGHFGASVSLSGNGNTALIGAATEDYGAGAAYVYVRSGTTWTQQQRLTASDGGQYDLFGEAVSLSSDGNTALIGAAYDYTSTGKAYIFVRSGTTWTQQQKLTPSDGAAGDAFGFSVSLSNDGNIALVGAPCKNGNTGAAYVFVRGGTTWTQQQKLTPSDGVQDDYFGVSVSLSGDGNTALVGTPGKSSERGAIYVFACSGTTWTQQQKLSASNSQVGDYFGSVSQSSDSNTALVGAPGKNGNMGAVYVFIYAPQVGPVEHPNRGKDSSSCPHCYTGGKYAGDPIGLRRGEVHQEVTDLSLNTPAGPLTFTRNYQQGSQSVYQSLGLGWTHNHNMWLTKTTGTPNTIVVRLPNGGQADFVEITTDHYEGVAGVGSVVDYNPTTSRYTLTASDKSTCLFNSAGQMLTRAWPSGESWTYTYSNGKLSLVDDGYGRQLQVVYVSNPGQYDNGQLWRVGDQTATGLSSGSPAGRYVEFTYIPEKNNGVTVTNPKALLAEVRDVRGNLWSYDYYGQHSGESATNQLNLLTARSSPQVDTTGDGIADQSITLESLSYTFSGTPLTDLTQQRGLVGTAPALLETAFAFQPSGRNVTTETVAGKTTTHWFDNGVYAGPEDPAGNSSQQFLNAQYRPETRTDANGNETAMAWSSDGKYLNQVTDSLENSTSFSYNSTGASEGTLAASTDAEGRQTAYAYGDSNNPRLPTRVKVLDGTTVLRWQAFTYDSQGRTLTEQTLDPANGTTVQQEVTRTYYTSGNGNGLLHTVTQTDIGGTNDTATTYAYGGAGRAVKTQQNSNFGGCTISYTVYDAAGNVVATICNYDPGSSADPTTAAEAAALFDEDFPDKNHVTAYEYDALGRRFKTTSSAGASYAQTTLTVYDALDRVVRTIANYVADSNLTDPFIHDRADFDHGTGNTQNLVTDTAYNERGMVRKSVDVLGNVTLYGYDDAGQMVKTVQSASQPDYDNTYGTSGDPALANYTPGTDPDQDIITSQQYDPAGNLVKTVDGLGKVAFTVYDALNRPVKTVRSAKDGATVSLNPGDTGYTAANDPRSDSYTPSAAPDRDLIDLTEYDSMGRAQRSQDSLGNWTLYGYEALGRQVKVIRNAATPAYNMTSDPALVSYTPNSAADQDIITQTAYDSSGRVLYSLDVQGERTWSKYDGLGRQVKTIANAVGTATDGSANDPRSDSYVPNSAPDRDLVSLTHYDGDGRVQWTLDPVNRKTWYVYDALGRQVKVIRNCSYTSGTPAPEDETYVGSTDPDKDLIAHTEYDAQGRAWKTLDDRGNETHYIYDVLGRQIQVITNYVDGVYDADYPDEDLITTTNYDLAGRVVSTVDAAGNETRYVYDVIGRRIQVIANYVDGVYSTSAPDEDLIMTTTFNRAGQVVSTTDVRGTKTAFVYDAVGRTLQVTQAAETSLVTISYTCYDKGGRTLRTIQNYRPESGDPAPDAHDTGSNWLFNPVTHGLANDENLITIYTLDKTGRQVAISDPLGNTTETTYFKAGGVESVTDPESAVSQYRYDRLGRRLTVVQGYQANDEDPVNWVWDNTDGRWEQSGGTPITFGDHNDRNVIAQVEYDKAGRMVALRDPRGNRTTYTYDLLDRRTGLTNPLAQTWATAFSDLTGGKSRLTLTDPLNQQTQQDFDRLGRLQNLAYLNETPKLTPDVTFSYNAAGVRTHMDETADGGTTFVRKTAFSYDKARRLTSVDFDTNGDDTVEQTVTYQYDAGGLRTRLTLPGSRDIVYTYNAKGQLVSLTDWANQTTRFAYDQVGRRVAAEHHNGLLHQYRYDSAGRLKRLRHSKNNRLLGQFEYQVDKRGNRTQVYEALPRATTGATTFAYTDPALDAYRGAWTDSAPFKRSANFGAGLRLAFCGMGETTLRMGVGPDHSIYDVYVDGALWQSFNGYAASAGDVALTLPLTDEGPHLLDLRNRPQKDKRSTGYVIRFHSLTTPTAARQFDLHTTQYTYDALAKLIAADSYPGLNTGAAATRHYAYAYDLAGNRTQANDNGTISNTTYNAANQMTSGGAVYDAAGRLTSDGTNTYTWDRANRLLSMGGAAYQYNGSGQRVQQTVDSLVTAYLNDLQPGLWQVLQATTGTDTTRYVHGPHGLQQQQNPDTAWLYPVQDSLGSLRGVLDADLNVLESLHYAPFGTPWGMTGTNQTDFGFTGEPTDATGLINLRARHYNPSLGTFTGLDPFEGTMEQPMSLNRYEYVQGNVANGAVGELGWGNRYAYANGDPVNLVDHSGFYSCHAEDSTVVSACQQLDEALNRGGALVPSIYDTVDTGGHLLIDKLEAVEDLFNVKFTLFRGMNDLRNPIDTCSSNGAMTNPVKRSLVTTIAALVHVVAALQAITSTPLDDFMQKIGRGSLRFQFGAAAYADTSDKTGLEVYGKTPQGAMGEPNNELYLGTQVTAATVVHELGHHVDRVNGPLSISRALGPTPTDPLWVALNDANGRRVGYARNFTNGRVPSRAYKVATQNGMTGQARLDDALGEVWGDMFMNWVLAYHYTRFGNPDMEVIGTPGWEIKHSYLEANAKAAFVAVAMQNLLAGTTPLVDADTIDRYVRGNVSFLPYQTF